MFSWRETWEVKKENHYLQSLTKKEGVTTEINKTNINMRSVRQVSYYLTGDDPEKKTADALFSFLFPQKK